MGCTSSAPNMTTTNPNATESKLEFDDEKNNDPIKKDAATMYAEEENGLNEIKVLPTCDTLPQPIQLDSNKKSTIDTCDLDLDKETHKDLENVYSSKGEDIVQVEEKLSSLEEVVEKVVELLVADISINAVEDNSERKELNTINKEVNKEQIKLEEAVPTKEKNEQDVDGNDGAASPSQSTSSRATRWEALADIAAELPPSLAVDPLTGQIYALSK